MPFTPSTEIHNRMRAQLAGVWVDRSLNEPHHWLVAKLPMNLIREIKAGATITLRAWVVEVDGYLIGSFGLTVYDDAAAPRTFFGCCRGEEETADLQVVLAAGRFPLQFHNENFLPLLYAQCRIDPEPARAVIALLPSAVYPTEQGLKPSGLANDVVEGVLSGKADPRIKASCDLPVLFEQDQTIKVILAGIGEVNLTDADEGGELERLTFAAFDSLFPYGVFHRPDFDKGGTREKLCDVLAVSRMREADGEGIFVIQNKVASAFPDGLKRKTERRAKSIQKNIMHGIRQLKGAIDNLREGKTIYRTKGGTSIEVDPPMPDLVGVVEPLNLRERASQIGQGIVLISDMHEGVDWEEVFSALAKVWLSTQYYCQVLDLMELGRLLTHSEGRPALLEWLLLRRGQVMVEKKTAFIRFRFRD